MQGKGKDRNQSQNHILSLRVEDSGMQVRLASDVGL